jgi:hypothetical protein
MSLQDNVATVQAYAHLQPGSKSIQVHEQSP